MKHIHTSLEPLYGGSGYVIFDDVTNDRYIVATVTEDKWKRGKGYSDAMVIDAFAVEKQRADYIAKSQLITEGDFGCFLKALVDERASFVSTHSSYSVTNLKRCAHCLANFDEGNNPLRQELVDLVP